MSLKIPPDGTYPGILRQLMTIGFPVVISTQIVIPDQRIVLDKYKKKFRKMQAAQKDSKGNLRVDVTAQVATQELIQIQQEIIASSVKTAKVSVIVGVHTSSPAWTSTGLRSRRARIGRAQATTSPGAGAHERGARASPNRWPRAGCFCLVFPDLAEDDRRDHDLLTPHAADLLALELPWAVQCDPR